MDFFDSLDNEVKKKFNWTLKLITTVERVPVKFFKHIENSDGLFEVRVEFGGNVYRVFSFFDKGKLVILINGFQKKAWKTPKREIEKAECWLASEERGKAEFIRVILMGGKKFYSFAG